MKEGWEVATLGNVCLVQSGAGFPMKYQGKSKGDYPFFKVSDMNAEGNETSLVAATNYIDEAERKALGARIFPAESVVFPKVGGAIATNKKRKIVTASCVDNNVMGVIPNQARIRADYLGWWLDGFDIYEFSNKANPPSITQATVNDWPIPLPPLEEQQRIVAILDEAFEGLKRARANAEANLQNARELFALNFEHEILRYRDLSQRTTIGEICTGFEYGTSAKSQPTGKMPVLRMGNLQSGSIDWDDLVYTDDASDIQKLALNDGDVLFNRTNSLEHVGKTAIYRGERPAIFAGYLIRLHFDRRKLLPDFLNLFLNSAAARSYGQSVAGKSVNQANISASKLKTYPIHLPPMDAQEAIVRKAEGIRQLLSELSNCYVVKLQDLEDLRQSLLQKAFAGELS